MLYSSKFMVQLWSMNRYQPLLSTLLGATRAAHCQSVMIQLFTVTALSGSFGHSWEAEGTEGNNSRKAEQQCGGVVQRVRTPACHAGGRALESRRARQIR